MNDSCHLTILDLRCPQSNLTMTAKKGDTGRTLTFLLTDNGEPYIISSECYAVFTAEKPDGSILYNDCTIRDNRICYTFTAQTCAVTGSLACEIKLYGADDKLITAPRFVLEVTDTIYTDGDVVESASEVSALTALVSKATELITDVEQKLADNAYADAHSAVCYTAQTLTLAQKTQARANIAAAPDGFGLGQQAVLLTAADDLNAVIANGWYYWDTANAPANVPIHAETAGMNALRVWSRDGTVCCQELMDMTSGDQQGCAMRRMICGNIFYVWEWINPPMAADTEYRTVLRHGTKPVYQKRVSLGSLPQSATASVSYSTETEAVRPITVTGTCGVAQDSQNMTLPTCAHASEAGQTVDLAASGNTVAVVTNFDASGYVGYANVAYWKTTDTALRITTHPVSVTAPLGDTINLTVAASGSNLSYQWQWRKNASAAWAASPATGNKTDTLVLEVTVLRHGYHYRCIVTDGAGNKAYSNVAVLTVTP